MAVIKGSLFDAMNSPDERDAFTWPRILKITEAALKVEGEEKEKSRREEKEDEKRRSREERREEK